MRYCIYEYISISYNDVIQLKREYCRVVEKVIALSLFLLCHKPYSARACSPLGTPLEWQPKPLTNVNGY